MKQKERERLEYRPNLKLQKSVMTNVEETTVQEDEVVVQEYSLPRFNEDLKKIKRNSKTSEAVGAYLQYNTAETAKRASDLSTKITKKLDEIEDKLAQNPKYAQYPEFIRKNDISWIDMYQQMAENIDGDILAEIYPIVYNIDKELKTLMNFINELCFDNAIDWFNIDGVIQKEKQKKQLILKAELEGKELNYKEIAIDTQLSKFFSDRVELLEQLFADITNPVTDVVPALPNDPELIKDYFEEIERICEQDKLKMNGFSSTGVMEEILEEIKRLKPKVLKNRELLRKAEKREFLSMIHIVKMIEDKLTNSIVDLYKFQIADEMYKADYVNSLKIKNQVRELYKGLGQAS